MVFNFYGTHLQYFFYLWSTGLVTGVGTQTPLKTFWSFLPSLFYLGNSHLTSEWFFLVCSTSRKFCLYSRKSPVPNKLSIALLTKKVVLFSGKLMPTIGVWVALIYYSVPQVLKQVVTLSCFVYFRFISSRHFDVWISVKWMGPSRWSGTLCSSAGIKIRLFNPKVS